jgi:TetR/AcrR family transcriptional repressor of lmrAB and yxaGH operons
MAALQKHKDGLISAACALFRRQGYAATGLAELLKCSGAPKGSLYHYFPDGKEGVAVAAIHVAGETLEAALKALAAGDAPPGDLVMSYGTLLAAWLEQSDFRDGCPIGTVMLEAAPASEKITSAGRQAFAAWAVVLSDKLVASGAARERAAVLADFTISALEGALILARVRKSAAPVLQAARELRSLYTASINQKEVL